MSPLFSSLCLLRWLARQKRRPRYSDAFGLYHSLASNGCGVVREISPCLHQMSCSCATAAGTVYDVANKAVFVSQQSETVDQLGPSQVIKATSGRECATAVL